MEKVEWHGIIKSLWEVSSQKEKNENNPYNFCNSQESCE